VNKINGLEIKKKTCELKKKNNLLYTKSLKKKPFDFIRRLSNKEALRLRLNNCIGARIDGDVALLLLIVFQFNGQQQESQASEQQSEI